MDKVLCNGCENAVDADEIAFTRDGGKYVDQHYCTACTEAAAEWGTDPHPLFDGNDDGYE